MLLVVMYASNREKLLTGSCVMVSLPLSDVVHIAAVPITSDTQPQFVCLRQQPFTYD